MHFQAALSIAVFGASALAHAVQEARQNSCVMCTEVVPTCPVCPASQECFVSVPQDCTECPQAYCADAAADATPTPTGILGGTTSSTSDGGFTLPTASQSESSTGTSTTSPSSTTTATAASGSTTASGASSTGASRSATGTAEAPGAESSAPAASGVGKNGDVAGVLRLALLMAVPVLGLQWL
ncbi:hypothetical protein KVR01_001384 [Diaporthe batatas]|uniref:uncharacterized protein n=1 Tax=Diaporthe batatas TaxID=748121 RepID=UPI001D04AAD6|nr:uncharacterized protein KVR01_001384 [Diaporthe batatas]KAG8168635.1 hypothetical protein KVR01_001384 [Diaporthe batatas]